MKKIIEKIKKITQKSFLLLKKVFFYMFPPEKTIHEKNVEFWNSDDGDKNKRLIYPLGKNSVVFDVGGYEGGWSSDIFSKYQCTIHVFEPAQKYIRYLKDRFLHNEHIVIHPFGLSNKNEDVSFQVTSDQSSVFIDKGEEEKVKMIKISDFIKNKNIHHIDLIKMNIEGGEYDLLENLIQENLIKNINNIQIQFHSFVPNAVDRMRKIQKELSKTHHLTYQYEFVWENWEKNTN